MKTTTHVKNHNRAIRASERGEHDRRKLKRWLNSLRGVIRETQRSQSDKHAVNNPNTWERAIRKLERDVFDKH